MPIVKCKICGSPFYTKPFWIKRGYGKYCSRECQHKSRKSGKMIKCFICGTEVYKQTKALKHSKSKKYFCGKSCQTKWRNAKFIGPKHANWKNGEYAYKSVLTRHKILRACGLCGNRDIRVLAVHHIDRKRTNNKIKNLAWLCHNCHFLVHHYDIERRKFMEVLV
ncbi:MAG: hypothetical protein AUJ39_00505 [Parcubacteria group bacterium CG1_02_42_13]|nr:MAG: hypothetical protein AUJ39_00505 [Parcubacteria group bacterium CG1_02_42_13]